MLRDLLERFSKQRFVPGDRGSEIQYQPMKNIAKCLPWSGLSHGHGHKADIQSVETEILRGFGTRRDFFPCRIYSFSI